MTEDECGDLHVFVGRDITGILSVTSLWRPSWRERLSILLFGRVWFTALGSTHPPISIYARRDL